jgi:hypothetical protein
LVDRKGINKSLRVPSSKADRERHKKRVKTDNGEPNPRRQPGSIATILRNKGTWDPPTRGRNNKRSGPIKKRPPGVIARTAGVRKTGDNSTGGRINNGGPIKKGPPGAGGKLTRGLN